MLSRLQPASRAHSGPGPMRVVSEFNIGKLTSVLAKKTQSDLDRVFKGTSKTRDKLSYMDEVLALWRLDGLEAGATSRFARHLARGHHLFLSKLRPCRHLAVLMSSPDN